jgi:hypothetical protein
MPATDLPNPYEASQARPLPQRSRLPFLIWTWVMIVVTLVTATPLVLFAGMYIHHRRTGPPTFPGDPDIGFGILMLLLIANAPSALGWLIWLVARFR